MCTRANASLIPNGDFQTCSFDGWSLDTDLLGEPDDTSDFSIINNAGQCSAQITLENSMLVNFNNSLITQLDLSDVANGVSLDLSFDWIFSGLDLQTDIESDLFSVYLNDGIDIEPLFSVFENGSGTFTTQIDNSYDGFFLEFVLQPGFNTESFASTFIIDNVALTEEVDVPAPHTSLLMAMGLAIIGIRRKHQDKRGAL
ncbi:MULTISPECIES: PEP-CTERM sorting domain-containing protein [unclassified Alteromonas]|uniref:PEP-CTERM sorting domain-containing protein n=1 Tax=unclassified Alteromonas TaxID=2614992 RepID=UPI0012682609|nr:MULTISPECIES: PEP-CTERM sorting domain-containing protein [unclassified Alteromonas]